MNAPTTNDQQPVVSDRRTTQRAEASARRQSERLDGPWVAQVRGKDAQGNKFTESTVLENVGAGGLFVRLRHSVAPGARLFVVFAFSSVALHDVPAPRVAARGEVRRIEARDDSSHGVGLQFGHHRFL